LIGVNDRPTPLRYARGVRPALLRSVLVLAAACGGTEPEPSSLGGTGDPPRTTWQQSPRDPSPEADAVFALVCTTPPCTWACDLDRGGWRDCPSPLAFPGLAEGPHRLRVRATGPAGRREVSPKDHAWTIDLTAPVLRLESAPPPMAGSRLAVFELACSEVDCAMACRLDTGAALDCAGEWRLEDVPEGPHRFELTASDAAGHRAEPLVHEWTVDVTPPDTLVESGPPSVGAPASARFVFRASEPDCVYQCELDGGVYGRCANPYEVDGLAPGLHVLSVWAEDAAGNRDPSPTRYEWTVAP
jgi:hypothetical protein